MVIDDAVDIEEHLLTIVKYGFRLHQPDDRLKATGDSGSVITARNRLDLLWDAGFIDEILWKAIKHVFEIRNKFAHQKSCVSFSNLSDTEVGRQSLKFLQLDVVKEENELHESFLERCWKLKINFINDSLDFLRGQIIAGIFLEGERYYSRLLLSELNTLLHNHLKVFIATKGGEAAKMIEFTNSIGRTIIDQFEFMLKEHRDLKNIDEQLKVYDKRGDIGILKYIDFSSLSTTTTL